LKHITQLYAERVVSGEVLACKWERLACLRHLNDLERIGNPDFPYVFDESRADRIYGWYKYCRHVRGPFSGQPIELQDWQKFDHGVLYGWVYADSGRRRFKKTLHIRARGNVKSTENSAKCNYHMCADGMYPPGHPEQIAYEMMPEVHCAAVDKGQAKRVWGDARVMAEVSPEIFKRLQNRAGKIPEVPPIKHSTRGGGLWPLSKDTKNKDSGAPCYVSLDEYHAHPTSLIYDREMSSFGKRMQSLLDVISTAGDSATNNPCKKEYDICLRILQGEFLADDYFIMIRQLDEGDDPHDQTKWPKANPILRDKNAYSEILLDEIKSEHNMAYDSGDADKIFEFLTRRCCMWQATAINKYLSAEQVEKVKKLSIPRAEFYELVKEWGIKTALSPSDSKEEGREAFAGLDMSKTIDLTADAHVFRLKDHPKYKFAITAHGFMPEERAEQHRITDRVPYLMWGKPERDYCSLTPGSVIDYDAIEDHMLNKELDQGWKIKELDYDEYNAEFFTQYLLKKWVKPNEFRVPIRQGAPTLSEPTKKLREMIISGSVVFEFNELFLWCCGNAVTEDKDNECIKLSKKHKDDSQRIDLLAAAINALTRALAVEESKSVYEERGLRSLA
jgi:phage terminase large subunit-like protein